MKAKGAWDHLNFHPPRVQVNVSLLSRAPQLFSAGGIDPDP